MTRARVWGWGDDPELVGKNATEYVDKRRKSTTVEYSIIATCRERSEGTLFNIITYVSEPEKAGDLANSLFDIALKGDNKVYFIIIELYEHMASKEKTYRNSLLAVEKTYEEHRQILAEKFKEHSRVKTLLVGKKQLVVFLPVTLLCELGSKHVNKVIVEISDYNFERGAKILHMLTNKLIRQGIATDILGYELWDNLDRLEIEEVYTEAEKVCLTLAYPATK
ncbi:MAG: hypothetical protein QXF52_08405 [Thermoproteota archaeon]